MTYSGIAIYPDKRVEERTFDRESGLEAKQEIVGGYIEAVNLADGSTMYVNETMRLGTFGPEDFNSIASDVAGLLGRADLLLFGILGPVVMVGPPDQEGWDTDLPDFTRKVIERVRREA